MNIDEILEKLSQRKLELLMHSDESMKETHSQVWEYRDPVMKELWEALSHPDQITILDGLLQSETQFNPVAHELFEKALEVAEERKKSVQESPL